MKAQSPTAVKKFIVNALMIGEIPYVSGPPGIGKSDLMEQVADEFDLKLLDVRLSQMLSEDLTGLPSLNEVTGKAQYNPFDTFPMENDPLPLDANGDEMAGWMIFLDELSSASEEVMAAIYSLLLGHRVGGKKVHPKARIVGAGNRAGDSAIARELPDTLITRMLCCEMKVSSKDWLKWARALPADVSNSNAMDFIDKYPDMLHATTDHNTRAELESYHTPRGWGKMMKIVNFHEKRVIKNAKPKKDSAGVPVPDDGEIPTAAIPTDIQHMCHSAVGVMAASAFCEHYNETMKLPYPWEVAQSPSSTRIPNSAIGKAKLTSSLADYFIESPEQARDKVLQFMNRMDSENAALFTEQISEKLGASTSDQQLVKEIRKRLNVNEISSPKVGEKTEDEIELIRDSIGLKWNNRDDETATQAAIARDILNR
jgi:hypothetical protein